MSGWLQGVGRVAGLVAGLLLGGLVLDPVVAPAWSEVRSHLPTVPSEAPAAAATERLLNGLLGGFRGLAANVAWLHLHGAWERSDPAAVETWVRLTTRLDPRPAFFWVQGARMLAYDVSAWRIRAEREATGMIVPEVVAGAIRRDSGRRALALLEQAWRVHPEDPWIAAEIALMHLHRMHDLELAATWYRVAAELPGSPAYAGRLHGELLRALGRPAEALAWYQALLPRLDPADPLAGHDVVRQRIAELQAGR